MFEEITSFEDIERDFETILGKVKASQNPVSSEKIMEIRFDINERICAVLAFARQIHGRFPSQNAYTRFCEDVEIIGDALRQHQMRWTPEQITKNHQAYRESSKQMEHVVHLWVGDMQTQLGNLPTHAAPLALK